MSTLKKFLIYFLMFASFFIISSFLEKGLISSMYGNIRGNVNNNNQMQLDVSEAKATKVNGYINFKITNNSNETIKESYAKIDLIDKTGLTAITEYAKVSDLESGKSKDYRINYRGNDINSYNINFVSEIPDKSNIINILGWEFDATNLFGLGIDLTNVYGVNVAKYLSPKGIWHLINNRWDYMLAIANAVPAWAYIFASIIVIWYL